MATLILDNSLPQYLLKSKVCELIESGKYSQIAIATGYWDLPGMVELYEVLKEFLSRDSVTFRLLLGEEPSVKSYQVKHPQKVDPNFPRKYLKSDLEELELKSDYQNVVELLVQHLRKNDAGNQKLFIKVYKKDFLHAKCYIFGSQEENAVGVIGSSNFTKKGLCDNLELNAVENNNSTVNYQRLNLTQHPSHRSWFEDLWRDSEDWSGVFREELLELSKHGSICYSPYEMYIHALYRIYGWELDDEKSLNVSNDETDEGKPKLLKFQIQNANAIIRKLDKHGVAMLADSVGLGKTYTAIKIIEYYRNRDNPRIVVVCPAGLKQQWQTAFADFKLVPLPEIYSMQDVNLIKDIRDRLRAIPVGLFVFDESHNLRSSGGQRFEEFIKWRQDNPKAKTLLLTATPINNQLSDLTNQVSLASAGNIHMLGKFIDRSKQKYVTLKERLDTIQSEIDRKKNRNLPINYDDLKEQLTPLINRFLVRRTRQGIEKEYPDGLEINGVMQKFPETRPMNLEYQLQNEYRSALIRMADAFPLLKEIYSYQVEDLTELEFLAHPLDLLENYERRTKQIQTSLEIVYSGILALGFPCYRYNIYKHAYYRNKRDEMELTQEQNRELSRQIGIYGIFRTIFLKRLESSLYSVHLSINTYEKKLKEFKDILSRSKKIISIKDFKKLEEIIGVYNPESSAEDELDIDVSVLDQNEIAYIEADETVYNIAQLKQDIEKDLGIIGVLRNQLALLTKKDNKLSRLAEKLNEADDRKVLVFTYFADTMKYMRDNLPALLRNNRNVEFALGTKYEIENFAERFSPKSKKYQLKKGEKEIDFLVATDKLSEGQNLQDCGIIINYDLHWNPVRMIQRNGRINRLGTKHGEIFIYNFRPTEQLESYLLLVRKLQDKINLIRYTIGTDQSVLDEQPIPQEFTDDLYSRDEQKRIAAYKKIFETSELLAADDLFLDDLRLFDSSTKLTDDYKRSIRYMPKGKWGKVMKSKSDDDFTHLAHIIDEEKTAGYFFLTGGEHGTEFMSQTEGLLHIQASSEENTRFKDNFQHKPQMEEALKEFISGYSHPKDRGNTFTDRQQDAVATLLAKMVEYGTPERDIQMVMSFLSQTQNVFWKKRVQTLVRKLNRVIRNNQVIESSLIDDFVQLAHNKREEVEEEKAPLKEIIQIFAR